jgi:hypothetical protein
MLAEVGRLHPHAKTGLLIEWGASEHQPTAEAGSVVVSQIQRLLTDPRSAG